MSSRFHRLKSSFDRKDNIEERGLQGFSQKLREKTPFPTGTPLTSSPSLNPTPAPTIASMSYMGGKILTNPMVRNPTYYGCSSSLASLTIRPSCPPKYRMYTSHGMARTRPKQLIS